MAGKHCTWVMHNGSTSPNSRGISIIYYIPIIIHILPPVLLVEAPFFHKFSIKHRFMCHRKNTKGRDAAAFSHALMALL